MEDQRDIDGFQVVTPLIASPPHVTIDLGAAMSGLGGPDPGVGPDGGLLSPASVWESGSTQGSLGDNAPDAAFSGPFKVSVVPDLGIKIAGLEIVFPVHRQVWQ